MKKKVDVRDHTHKKIWIFVPAICLAAVLSVMLWNVLKQAVPDLGEQTQADSVSEGQTQEDSVLEGQTQVLMIYMVGSDLESERGLASADIREIQESGFDEERLQIILCTGGAAYWWNDSVSADECAVFEVHADELKKVYTLNDDNMSEPAAVTEFMDFAYGNYAADSYSMILWDHGGGAVVGYGGDENHYYDMLALYQLREAFADTKMTAEGKKLEWIGFDACLMGMLEVADTCAPYADYLVASEGMTADSGWDYSFLKRICEGTDFSGESVGGEIVESYSGYYAASETYEPEYTLACMDLTKTGQVIDQLEVFIRAAEQDLKAGSYSVMAKERDQVKAFGIIDTSVNYDIVDLYDLAGQFADLYPLEAEKLQEAVEELVIYEKTNVADAHGVGIYFPYNNRENVREWLEEYDRIGFSNSYVDFVKDFSETLTGDSLADWNLSEVVPTKEGEGRYAISFTSEQADHYAHAMLSTWKSMEEWEEGCYVMWIESSDTVLDESGTLHGDVKNKRFILRDDAGHSAACSATELERNENYVIYGIAIYLSWINEDAADYSSKYGNGWATVYVRVDEENPNGMITGIYEGTGMEMAPGRISCELKQGAEISPFAYIRQITFDNQGKVVPFEEWEIQSTIFTGFKLEGNLSVTMTDIEEDADLLHVFFISDTQGNVYTTNYVE